MGASYTLGPCVDALPECGEPVSVSEAWRSAETAAAGRAAYCAGRRRYDMSNNVYPFRSYQDAPAAINWLQKAFGAEVVASFEGPADTIAHAELRFESGIVMMGSARSPQKGSRPRTIEEIEQGVYIAVADIESHYARAKAANAEITRPLEDTDYGSREYSAVDPEGYWWSFGTYHPAGAS
jgi:uncharacterized glyoxalase superfamily protein PhnB